MRKNKMIKLFDHVSPSSGSAKQEEEEEGVLTIDDNRSKQLLQTTSGEKTQVFTRIINKNSEFSSINVFAIFFLSFFLSFSLCLVFSLLISFNISL